jgi:hypothetical protein
MSGFLAGVLATGILSLLAPLPGGSRGDVSRISDTRPPESQIAPFLLRLAVTSSPVRWHDSIYVPVSIPREAPSTADLSLILPQAKGNELIIFAPAGSYDALGKLSKGDLIDVRAVPDSFLISPQVVWKNPVKYEIKARSFAFLKISQPPVEALKVVSPGGGKPEPFPEDESERRFLALNGIPAETARWGARMPGFTGLLENRIRPLQPEDYGDAWRGRAEYPFHSMFMAGVLKSDTAERYAVGVIELTKQSRHFDGIQLDVTPLGKEPGNISEARRISVRIPRAEVIKERKGETFTTLSRDGALRLDAGSKVQTLSMETPGWRASLTLENAMKTANWWNLGNPMFFFDGSALMGHDTFLKVKGTLTEKASGRTSNVSGVFCNERNYSVNPVFDWSAEDWLSFDNDEVLCLIFRRTHKKGSTAGAFFNWIDGFIYLRKADEYVPLDKASIEYTAMGRDKTGKPYPLGGRAVCWGRDGRGRLIGLKAEKITPLSRAESALSFELPCTARLSLLTEKGTTNLSDGFCWIEFDRE